MLKKTKLNKQNKQPESSYNLENKSENLSAPTNNQPSKRKRILRAIVPIIPLLIGLYLLSLVFAPKVIPYINSGKVEKTLNSSLPKEGDDRLYIKELGVNAELNTGGEEAMNGGNAWHRFPERGDPVAGGNFIISAHRWIRGNTPQETIKQSPFYNTDRLKIGDAIVVDFGGNRYKYEIYEIFNIKPDQTEIESPLAEGQDPIMTLYTCTLKGAADGRVVIRARLAKI
jgi:LPXTG-site transpeptidase (sortase) family protein